MQPIFRYSPWWAFATAVFGCSSVLYAAGASSVGASKTWIATFLIVASALATAGTAYVVILQSLGQHLPGRIVARAALVANAATLAFALAVATSMAW